MQRLSEREINLIAKAERIFIFLDYDGTLTPIRPHPSLARLTPSNKKILKKLSRLPHVKICIISGRLLADLRKQVGLSNLIYVGNHGFELEGIGKKQIRFACAKTKKLISRIDAKLKLALKRVQGIFVENKNITLSVHYRSVSKKNVPVAKFQLMKVLAPYLDRSQVVLREGKKVWEVRPAVKLDKGSTVLWLLERMVFKMNHSALPIYLGDDQTDEDALKRIRHEGIGIKVTAAPNRASFASYYLPSIKEVYCFLERLVFLRSKQRKCGSKQEVS